MKGYVVDTSVSLKWVFDDEENSKIAKSILKDYFQGKISLVAPDLWIYEIANGLKSATLSKRITKQKGRTYLDLLIKSKPSILPAEPIIQSCFALACEYEVSIYDSTYLALAIENRFPFITGDSKLYNKIKSFGKLVVFLNQYSSKE